jgi:DNA-binding MarR family transcriptional regulator
MAARHFKPTKAEKLTEVTLSVFHLNGLLIEWGDRFSAPHGITSARWQVLGAMALASQPASVPHIAASMGLTRQGVQKQIDLLVDDGLVESAPNPAHKRSPLYALTGQGAKLYQQLDARWNEHVQTLSDDFSAADLDAALRVLSALSEIHADTPERVDDTPAMSRISQRSTP